MNKIDIRQITTEQLDEFFEVFSKGVLELFPEYTERTLTHMLSSDKDSSKNQIKHRIENGDVVLAAFVNEKIVGVFVCDEIIGGVCFSDWLLIVKPYQNQGIGKKILGEWERICKEKGVHMLILETYYKNVNYYKKLGFKESGYVEKSYYGQDLYTMTKLIQEPKEENFLK